MQVKKTTLLKLDNQTVAVEDLPKDLQDFVTIYDELRQKAEDSRIENISRNLAVQAFHGQLSEKINQHLNPPQTSTAENPDEQSTESDDDTDA